MSDPERLIVCTLCSDKVSSFAMAEHLMTCGNKTDPCPTCHKYIRRAIFAYHYENNCANIETDEVNSRVVVPHLSPESNSGDRKNVFTASVDLTNHRTAEENLASTEPATIECQFCHYLCETAKQDIHTKNCLRNPANIPKRVTSPPRRTFDHQNQSQPAESLNDRTEIPCEYCQEPIEWKNYESHTYACAARLEERNQEQTQRTYTEYTTSIIQYLNCDGQRSEVHVSCCTNVPDYIYTERRYKSAYNLPRTAGLTPPDHLN